MDSAVEAPVLSAGTSTATSISLFWTSAGSEVVSYEVMWETDNIGGCSGGSINGGSDSISGDMTNYTIESLEEYITYSITVRASNSESSEASEPVSGMTTEAGEYTLKIIICLQ